MEKLASGFTLNFERDEKGSYDISLFNPHGLSYEDMAIVAIGFLSALEDKGDISLGDIEKGVTNE